MRSLLIALLALASSAAFAAPSLTTPPSAAAGSTITFKATGTGNPREFVTVVPKGAREGAYFAYVYVTGTGDLKLAMPATPGDYELRLCAADSPYKTLAHEAHQAHRSERQRERARHRSRPARTFEVKWTGPNNERDYITIGETTPGGTALPRLQVFARRQPGEARRSREARQLRSALHPRRGRHRHCAPAHHGGQRDRLGDGARPGGRRRQIQSELDRPEQCARLRHHGQGRHEEKTYERYEYTSKGKTLELTAPDVPGEYEIRYATGKTYITLARATITVGAITGTITGPAQVVAGETFKVTWKGPDNARNFVTIVPKGAREGAYSGSYFYTTPQNNPGNLVAPLAPGEYELRYSTAEQYLHARARGASR